MRKCPTLSCQRDCDGQQLRGSLAAALPVRLAALTRAPSQSLRGTLVGTVTTWQSPRPQLLQTCLQRLGSLYRRTSAPFNLVLCQKSWLNSGDETIELCCEQASREQFKAIMRLPKNQPCEWQTSFGTTQTKLCSAEDSNAPPVLVCGVACAWGFLALRVRKQQRGCLVTAQDLVRPRCQLRIGCQYIALCTPAPAQNFCAQ
jgi:hypothetical protein